MKDHRQQYGKTDKRRRTQWGLLLAVLVSAAVLATGFTMAKYVNRWQSDPALAEAKAFYFTSDLLKEAGGDNKTIYELYGWGEGIKIDLRNFEDEKRFSETDITYEVTCTPETGTVVQDAAGTIPGKSVSSKAILIKPEPGASTVTVTAKATGPYRKTLTATFTLKETAQPQFQIVDATGNAAAELIIKGGNTTKEFILSWNSDQMTPDRTNTLLRFSGESQAKLTIPASGSCSILLFKSDPASDFSTKLKELAGDDNNISLNAQ